VQARQLALHVELALDEPALQLDLERLGSRGR
jgi:hypothetical protein